MSSVYAMSDIHGCLQAFDEALNLIDLSGDNKLVLCGDYIHEGQDNYGVLDRIIELERKYGSNKIIVLAGNHEDMAIDGRWPIGEDRFSGSVLTMMTAMIGTFYGCKIYGDITWKEIPYLFMQELMKRLLIYGNGERMIILSQKNILLKQGNFI